MAKAEQNSDEASAHLPYLMFAQQREVGNYVHVTNFEDVNEAIHAVAKQLCSEVGRRFHVKLDDLWGKSLNKDVSGMLKPAAFHGRLDNTRVVHLPVTAEYEADYLKNFLKSDVGKKIVGRICILTDLLSTGRGKVGESLQDIVFYTVQPDGGAPTLNMSVRGYTPGQRVAVRLNKTSPETAILEGIRNLKRPTSGGFPGTDHR